MESWALRRVNANQCLIHSCIARFQHNTPNLDFIDDARRFRYFANEMGDHDTSSLLFSSFKETLGPQYKDWATSRFAPRRYCPACFREDDTPYLRLYWRLVFGIVCFKHKLLLEQSCKTCGAQLKPVLGNPHFDIGICAKCGRPLLDTPRRQVAEDSDGYVAIRTMVDIAFGRVSSSDIDWSGTPQDFLATMRFLSLFIATVEGFPKRIHSSGLFEYQSEPWAEFKLAAAAWSLILHPSSLEEMIRRHQRLFTQQTYNSRPEFLQKFRFGRGPCPRLDLAPALNAADELANKGLYVTLKRVTTAIGLHYHTLMTSKNHYELGLHVEILQARYKERRRSNIIETIGMAQVCRRLTFSWLTKTLRENSGKTKFNPSTDVLESIFAKDPALRGLLQEAMQRTRAYYSAFTCKNQSCPEYHSASGHIVSRWIRGNYELDPVRTVQLRCTICNTHSTVDTSRAPLQHDYPSWDSDEPRHASEGNQGSCLPRQN